MFSVYSRNYVSAFQFLELFSLFHFLIESLRQKKKKIIALYYMNSEDDKQSSVLCTHSPFPSFPFLLVKLVELQCLFHIYTLEKDLFHIHTRAVRK